MICTLLFLLHVSILIIAQGSSSRQISAPRGNTSYIILSDANEGMSKWSYVVSDLMLLSCRLSSVLSDTVFVEPCFRNGRISDCSRPLSIGLSSIYDFKAIENVNPLFKWISWGDFTEESDSFHKTICFHESGRQENITQFAISKGITDIVGGSDIESCMRKVIKQNLRRQNAFYLSRVWKRDKILHKAKSPRYIFGLQFIPEHFQRVQQFLVHSGIHNGSDYVAFSWRSETSSVYKQLTCASKLVHAAKRMSIIYPSAKLILISDISFSQNEALWGGMVRQKTSLDVVKLLNSTFLKLETLPDRIT